MSSVAPFVAMPGAPIVASDRSVRSDARSPDRSVLAPFVVRCDGTSMDSVLCLFDDQHTTSD